MSIENLELHGTRAALRGNPSFVWRAGQNRRLAMILHWGMRAQVGSPDHPKHGSPAPDTDLAGASLGRVLVDGCGVGMYVKALLPFAASVAGIDIEWEHLQIAAAAVPEAQLELAACEALPYPTSHFDLVLSHEVLEHVADDRAAAAEIARVLKPGGRAIIFVPNRLYPFETHGHYWRGEYHFGNTPLINYLPDLLRRQLAPHVRAYTARSLRHLFLGQPVRILHHTQIYPGYDNIAARRPALGTWVRRITYALENTPLTAFGLSHFLVVEKVPTS
jgi:SAM-dependent methyltransferase